MGRLWDRLTVRAKAAGKLNATVIQEFLTEVEAEMETLGQTGGVITPPSRHAAAQRRYRQKLRAEGRWDNRTKKVKGSDHSHARGDHSPKKRDHSPLQGDHSPAPSTLPTGQVGSSIVSVERVPEGGMGGTVEPKVKPAQSSEPVDGRGEAARQASLEVGFDEFWKLYPPRSNRSRKNALKAWVRARRNGATVEQILAALKPYRAERDRDVAEKGKARETFTKMPETWLNAAVWENETQAPASAAPEVSDDVWRQRLAAWDRSRTWQPAFGPTPTDPMHRIPMHLMEERKESTRAHLRRVV